MVSELTELSAKLESTRKQAQFARQLVEVDLQLAAEVSFWYFSLPFESFVGCFYHACFLQEIRKVSSCKSHFLWAEHARMAELERPVESACRESQVRAAEAAAAWAEGQRAAERATAAEQGLEATKAR